MLPNALIRGLGAYREASENGSEKALETNYIEAATEGIE